MEYHEIGKTGMKVSALSFGASSLGAVFHDINEPRAIEAVHTAVDGGMNFIDVSPYYGHYKAETVLGKALREIPRDKYYLSTKVGRYGKDGVNTWDYSGRRATESVYESMERLGIDHIDLINVHDIEFADLNQVVGETLPALVELRDKGVVGHVGITDLQPENIKWVLDHTPEGMVETIMNFCHYSLNDDMILDYLDYFEERVSGSSAPRRCRWGCCRSAECLRGIRLRSRLSRHAARLPNTAPRRAIPSRSLPCSMR